METFRRIISTLKQLTVFIMSICILSCGQEKTVAQDDRPDYTSSFPQYTFPGTLEEQEEALKTNPLMLRFAESRARLSSDPHRPIYHFVNPEGNLNDPNGFSFWNGNWHLFYQASLPGDGRQHWGHAISKDLVHWRDLPLAIYPNPERVVCSGSALVEEDRVIVMYDGSEAGNMVAVSDDPLLLNWKKITGGPVIPLGPDLPVKPRRSGNPLPYLNRVGDPFIWENDGIYYAIIGDKGKDECTGKLVRVNHLFRSEDLKKWEYMHEFVEGDRYTLVDDDGSCPYFWPIGDRHILLFFSHYSGGQYLLGDYDTKRHKFVVTSHGYFNHGPVRPGGVHAPSATPDVKGGVINIFNINEGKSTEGWNQIMSLPMRLTLKDSDELKIEPAGDIESLRYNHQSVEKMVLPANKEIVLDNIKGNAMEIKVEIDHKDARHIEMNVLRSPGREEYTRILFYNRSGFRDMDKGPPYSTLMIDPQFSTLSINTDYSSILSDVKTRPTETAPLYIEDGENLKLRVFIDKSVVEVYANGKQYAAVRVYPGLGESIGVSLRSHGGKSEIVSLDTWQMKNIWDISLEKWHEKSVWR